MLHLTAATALEAEAAKMIEDGEIGKYSTDKQLEIRRDIQKSVSMGHNPDHLILSADGSVMLDLEAASFELEKEMSKNLKPAR